MSTTVISEINEAFRLKTIFHELHRLGINHIHLIGNNLNSQLVPAMNGMIEKCLENFIETSLNDHERQQLMTQLEEEIAKHRANPSVSNLCDCVELYLLDKEFHDRHQIEK